MGWREDRIQPVTSQDEDTVSRGNFTNHVVVKARVSFQIGERTCPVKVREEAEERRPS